MGLKALDKTMKTLYSYECVLLKRNRGSRTRGSRTREKSVPCLDGDTSRI